MRHSGFVTNRLHNNHSVYLYCRMYSSSVKVYNLQESTLVWKDIDVHIYTVLQLKSQNAILF